MDSAASLLSPSSSSPTAGFSPLASPRGVLSPASCSSPPSFSFSPLPSPRALSSSRSFRGFPEASPWDCPRPLTDAFLPAHPPPRRRNPSSSVHVAAYATTVTEPPLSPPSASPPRRTHYMLLGVSPRAAPQEIRTAYRKMALLHHPDVSPLHQLPAATRLFAEINEAYSTLADPLKRQRYDLQLALESPAAVVVGSPSPHASPRQYTDAATGRVYPSMNSFYREWRNTKAAAHRP